jgi:RimJ/RimL family protein N-acetyltransferase
MSSRMGAMLRRSATSEEGTLRQYQLVDGRYLDCISYSMLAEDWRTAE